MAVIRVTVTITANQRVNADGMGRFDHSTGKHCIGRKIFHVQRSDSACFDGCYAGRYGCDNDCCGDYYLGPCCENIEREGTKPPQPSR